jgi:hypothetical protein
MANAQSIRFGPSIGFTFPNNQDFSITQAINSTLEFDGDIHYGAKLKIGFPVVPVTITGGFMYTKLSGSISGLTGDAAFYAISAGGEYALIPGPIQPYAALDLMYTSLGDFSFNNISTDNSAGRFGLGLGAGVDIKILPKIDVDVSLKYCFNNLIGKKEGENSFNTANISVNILFNVL